MAFAEVDSHFSRIRAESTEDSNVGTSSTFVHTTETGTRGTCSWRMDFSSNTRPISPLNDLPLYGESKTSPSTVSSPSGTLSANAAFASSISTTTAPSDSTSELVTCVCTTPAATWLIHEASQDEPFHPLCVSFTIPDTPFTSLMSLSKLEKPSPTNSDSSALGQDTRTSDNFFRYIPRQLLHSPSQASADSPPWMPDTPPSALKSRASPSRTSESPLRTRLMAPRTSESPTRPRVSFSPRSASPLRISEHLCQPSENLVLSPSSSDATACDPALSNASLSPISSIDLDTDLEENGIQIPCHFVDNSPYNIGYLPQTWANPKRGPMKASLCNSEETGHLADWRYDGLPAEVIEVGAETSRKVGEVYMVKPLGAFLVGDEATKELSWKVIAIAADDPLAKEVTAVACLQLQLPGILDLMRQWLRQCLVFQPGDEPQSILLGAHPIDAATTRIAIEELHKAWRLRATLGDRSVKPGVVVIRNERDLAPFSKFGRKSVRRSCSLVLPPKEMMIEREEQGGSGLLIAKQSSAKSPRTSPGVSSPLRRSIMIPMSNPDTSCHLFADSALNSPRRSFGGDYPLQHLGAVGCISHSPRSDGFGAASPKFRTSAGALSSPKLGGVGASPSPNEISRGPHQGWMAQLSALKIKMSPGQVATDHSRSSALPSHAQATAPPLSGLVRKSKSISEPAAAGQAPRITLMLAKNSKTLANIGATPVREVAQQPPRAGLVRAFRQASS
eukprot:TRINITY_DN11455_c0_g1_i1.p2 TRINITY_DN11455_c0_g1~~TRINITY_DN11455_c0_g1_i1.p2  ORF type:complete len:733 (-),score=67.06 TRINITY_DN11455_c0_g1_i1:5246-7444(-)